MGEASPQPFVPSSAVNSTRIASFADTSPLEMRKGSWSGIRTQCSRSSTILIRPSSLSEIPAMGPGRGAERNFEIKQGRKALRPYAGPAAIEFVGLIGLEGFEPPCRSP